MPVYICRKCKRLHTADEYVENRFCRNCGTLLSETTPPVSFQSVSSSFRIKTETAVSAKKPVAISPKQFSIKDTLLEIEKKFNNAEIFIREFPEKDPEYGRKPLKIADAIRLSLSRQGMSIEKLYVHQTEAIDNVLEGRNVVLSTSTASGKTLCFNIPVLNSIFLDGNTRVLYIYPTKSLAQDQIRKIAAFRDNYPEGKELYESGYYFQMVIGKRKIVFGKYEGPTPEDDRKRIREFCHIVLTNPDMLHFGILKWNRKWVEFIKNLKYVVLDEIHVYRGIFGSNVSLVLRRLRAVCEALGSKPQFILCSATIPNALEHAINLTGCRDFVLVNNDGSPRKRKTLVLWNPPLDKEKGRRIEALTNIVDILTRILLSEDKLIKTIVFGRSRSSVKNAYNMARDRLKKYGRPFLCELIREYTATLLPERREEIFKELVNDKIHAIIGTNALELGIDIPEMSCYLSIGYPGTMTSVFQQFGRVGRTGEGLGIIILQNEPLEQYFARNASDFFDRKPEEVRINPGNFELLRMHLACCAHELDTWGGLPENYVEKYFSSEGVECISQLYQQGKLLQGFKKSNRIWKFNYKYEISDEYLPIRNPISKDNFTIECNGKEVGVMDSSSVLRDLHQEAIWTDNDRQYKVVELDFDDKKAKVEKVNVNYYTFSVPRDSVRILKEYCNKNIGCLKISLGIVLIKREVTEFCKIVPGETAKDASWEKIPWKNDIPSSIFHTEAIWITLPNEKFDNDIDKEYLEGGIHAVEHAIAAMTPKWISSDPNDLSGTYELSCTETNNEPTIFLYENFPGGVGLANACYNKINNILEDCIKLLETCKCIENVGCPSCIQLSQCPKHNQKLDKKAALSILKSIR